MEILGITAVLLLLVAVPVIVVNRDLLFNRSARKHASREEPPLPFLIIPSSGDASRIVPAGVSWRAARPTAPAAEAEPPAAARWAPDAEDEEGMAFEPESDAPADDVAGEQLAAEQFVADQLGAEPVVEQATPDPFVPERTIPRKERPVSLPVSHERWARPIRIEEEDEEPEPTDATMVFSRPVDEPVQILPGRLQILSGDSRGEDLRLFSKIGETPQIVVGRETGPPYRHITLHSPTVSRRHARMDFIDGNWTITNLSATNPVLVNDRILQNGGSTKKLSDGDRIELGEVALRFLAS